MSNKRKEIEENDNEMKEKNKRNKREEVEEKEPKKYSTFLRYSDNHIGVQTEIDEINEQNIKFLLHLKKGYNAKEIIITLTKEIPFPFKGVYIDCADRASKLVTWYDQQKKIVNWKTVLQWKLLFMLIRNRWKKYSIRNIPRLLAVYITKFVTDNMIVNYYCCEKCIKEHSLNC